MGVRGKIKLQNEEGTRLVYYSPEKLEELADDYRYNRVDDMDQLEETIKRSYTIINGGIVFYTFDVIEREYSYTFKNRDISLIDLKEKGNNSEYNVNRSTPININTISEVSKYTIPIELMMNFLTITGSDEFVREFIDYALDRTEINITLYIKEDESYKYDYKETVLNSNFIMEGYHFYETESFNTYKRLVYDRIHNNPNDDTDEDVYFSTGLLTFEEQIEEEIDYRPENNERALLLPARYHLTLANEANSAGRIVVEELIIKRELNTNANLRISSGKTWYANISYTSAEEREEYYVGGNEESCLIQEYNEYLEKLKREAPNGEVSTDAILEVYSSYPESSMSNARIVRNGSIWEKRDGLSPSLEEARTDQEAKEMFERLKIKGLGLIGQRDGGIRNETRGIDYIYSKYKNNSIRETTGIRERKVIIDESSIVMENYDYSTIYEFLALLKNRTGTIEGISSGYDALGKVVEYEDIYDERIYGSAPYTSKAKVGDLLENGVDVMCQLLASSPNTQGIENEYRYIMFLYTGINSGLTDEQLAQFSMVRRRKCCMGQFFY